MLFLNFLLYINVGKVFRGVRFVIYSASNGLGLMAAVDSSSSEGSHSVTGNIAQCFTTTYSAGRLLDRLGTFTVGADAHQSSLINHSQRFVGDSARSCATSVLVAGQTEGACPTKRCMLLSGAECQQFCSNEFKSVAARRRTHSDNIRVRPYERRFSGIASSWPELRNSAAAYNLTPTLSHVKVVCIFMWVFRQLKINCITDLCP